MNEKPVDESAIEITLDGRFYSWGSDTDELREVDPLELRDDLREQLHAAIWAEENVQPQYGVRTLLYEIDPKAGWKRALRSFGQKLGVTIRKDAPPPMHCGRAFSSDAQFCNKCGKALR